MSIDSVDAASRRPLVTGSKPAGAPDGHDKAPGVEGIDVPNCVTVKVWDLPVRVIHWTTFAAVIVLAATGFYIATPFFTSGTGEAYLMGKVRAVHLVAGWVFIAAFLARIAWAFLGNRWARWDQFIPIRKERRRLFRHTLAFYLLLRKDPPPVVGHNALAGLAYAVLYLMFLVQILTGLALEQLYHRGHGFLWAISGWVFRVAPIPMVRLVHHMIMWFTLAFIIHHVYSAVLVDREERSGLVSSIFTGTKRLPRDVL